jgi:hypothetical protein
MDITNEKNSEAANLEAPTITAPKKAIVRKTIPKKYLDYLKFAFVAMNNGGNFAEIVKLKEPVDNIINNVKAIVDNDELGERINEIRKELLKKPREKKVPGAPKVSNKKRKSDSEAGEAGEAGEGADAPLTITSATPSVPKAPRKKAKSAVTHPTASPGTTLVNALVDGITTPPSGKDVPKAPRKKAKSSAVDQLALAPVAIDLTNALENASTNPEIKS